MKSTADNGGYRRTAKHSLIAAAVAAVVTAGAIGSQAIALPEADQPAQAQQNPMLITPGPASFSGLVKSVKPAVVNISISGHAPARGQRPFGGPEFRGFPEGSPFEDFFKEGNLFAGILRIFPEAGVQVT